MSRDPRDELGEWVRYLKDIGVRELRVAGPGGRSGRSPVALAASAGSGGTIAGAGADDPLAGARRTETRSRPAALGPASGDLFSLSREEKGETTDPVHRLREIREEIGDCTRCKLHSGRNNLVFGVGNPRAELMFIGEGPGADEDAQGEPFVGRAGQKLNEMIAAIGLQREDVYIANVVKCRPPDNRAPESDEVATCSPFLFAQIEAIRPKVIVTLGAPATRTVLGTKIGITRIRGTWHTYMGIPVMPTFHPAYLLRAYTPENRRKVWEDLKAARARTEEEP